MDKKLVIGKKFWNLSADQFGRTIETKYIVYPALKKLCGIVRDKKILDLGCANGELSLYLGEKGASVIGIDYSPKMIEVASKKAKTKGIKNLEFMVMDIRNLSKLEKVKFDIIIINVVLPHLKQKEDLKKAMKEAAIRLKRKGKLLLAEPHPCFDSLIKKELLNNKRTSSYFHSGKPYEFKIKLTRSGRSIRSIAYHWAIEDYAYAIHTAGLVIKNIHEPKPVRKAALENPEWYKKRMGGYPPYIIFELGR